MYVMYVRTLSEKSADEKMRARCRRDRERSARAAALIWDAGCARASHRGEGRRAPCAPGIGNRRPARPVDAFSRRDDETAPRGRDVYGTAGLTMGHMGRREAGLAGI